MPQLPRQYLDEYLAEKSMTLDDFNAMNITLMHNTSEGHARIAAAIQQMWKDTLGVDVEVENQEWGVYLDTVDNPDPAGRYAAYLASWLVCRLPG